MRQAEKAVVIPGGSVYIKDGLFLFRKEMKREIHMAPKNKVEVLIDGRILTLSGYESEEYLQRVATYLNNKIGDLKTLPGYSRQTPDMKSALLALNIADDYFKAKSRADAATEDGEVRDREAYDVRQDLVAAQIQLDRMRHEKEQLEKEKTELAERLKKANEELDELLR